MKMVYESKRKTFGPGLLTLCVLVSMMAALPVGAAVFQANGGHGTTRGNSYPVKVVVRLGDQAIAGITVTATAKNSVTAVTDENGIAAFTLISGTYSFTASNDSGSGTMKAKVVASSKPLIVKLPLTAKTQ